MTARLRRDSGCGSGNCKLALRLSLKILCCCRDIVGQVSDNCNLTVRPFTFLTCTAVGTFVSDIALLITCLYLRLKGVVTIIIIVIFLSVQLNVAMRQHNVIFSSNKTYPS